MSTRGAVGDRTSRLANKVWSNSSVRHDILAHCDGGTLAAAMRVSKDTFKDALSLLWESTTIDAYRQLCLLGLDPKRLLTYLKPVRVLNCGGSEFPPNDEIDDIGQLFNMFPHLRMLLKSRSALMLPIFAERQTAPASHVFRISAVLSDLSHSGRLFNQIVPPKHWKAEPKPILSVKIFGKGPRSWLRRAFTEPDGPKSTDIPAYLLGLDGLQIIVNGPDSLIWTSRLLQCLGSAPTSSLKALSINLHGLRDPDATLSDLLHLLVNLRVDELYLRIRVTLVPTSIMLLTLSNAVKSLGYPLKTLDVVLGARIPSETDDIPFEVNLSGTSHSAGRPTAEVLGRPSNGVHQALRLRLIAQDCCHAGVMSDNDFPTPGKIAEFFSTTARTSCHSQIRTGPLSPCKHHATEWARRNTEYKVAVRREVLNIVDAQRARAGMAPVGTVRSRRPLLDCCWKPQDIQAPCQYLRALRARSGGIFAEGDWLSSKAERCLGREASA